MKFREDINFLRAFAVISVVLFHFKMKGFAGGFMGVDVFFVISGYLMTKIIYSRVEKGGFNYLDFVLARVARIVPALLVLVVVLGLLGALMLPPLDFEQLGRESVSALLFFSNIYFRDGQGYFLSGLDERWLLHTWSLSVEWQFYLLYPLFLWGLISIARRLMGEMPADALRKFTLAAVGVLFLLSFALCVWKTSTNPGRAFFTLQFRAWEMAGGGLVFLCEPYLQQVSRRLARLVRVGAVAALLVALALASMQDWEANWPGWRAFVSTVAAMLIIASGGVPAAGPARWMQPAVFQRIGLWSYSIYLWHWPVVIGLNYLFYAGQIPLRARLAGIGASIALGWLSFLLVESRVKFVPGRSGRRATGGVLVGATAAVLLGAGVVESRGWFARVGDDSKYFEAVAGMTPPSFYPDSCRNAKKLREELVMCSVNPDASGPRVLVYGDSHAEHLYPWFKAHATQRVDFIASSGCPPVPGFNRREAGYHCDQFMGFVDEMMKRNNYSAVIAAGNWDGGMDAEPSSLCFIEGGQCAGVAQRLGLVAANKVYWEKLLAAGKTVVLVDQSPFSQFNLRKVNARRRYLGMAPIESFAPMQPYSGKSRYIKEIVGQLSAYPNLHRVSFREKLCRAETCKAIDGPDGLPVFIDSNHFVAGWMVENGGEFSRFVK